MRGPVLRAEGTAAIMMTSNGAITLSVPIRLTRRTGRKRVGLDQGSGARPWDAGLTPFQQALGRGFRWLRQLDAGEVGSMSDIARREGADPSYVARMLNLTLLAPAIIEAIVDDTLPDQLRLHDLAINPPMLWDEQKKWA